MTEHPDARLAVYWAPAAEHPLWAAGCRWLGRNPERLAEGNPTVLPPARWPEAVSSPAFYGFHATLKAPMHLVDGATTEDFVAAVATLARRHRDFDMPPLHIDWLAGFLALRPVGPLTASHPLRLLADDCVQALDPWRGRPTASAQRRAEADLPAEQRALMTRWGYPHVLSHWRFHLTLCNTGIAPDGALGEALAADAARDLATVLQTPLRCGGVCVFRQARPAEPFELLTRISLAP